MGASLLAVAKSIYYSLNWFDRQLSVNSKNNVDSFPSSETPDNAMSSISPNVR